MPKMKKSTVRLRKSRCIPTTIQIFKGSLDELSKYLSDRELGWYSGGNLYIKIGKKLRRISGDGGGTPIRVAGTSGQINVESDDSTGEIVYTISLDPSVLTSVPPKPSQGQAGYTLTVTKNGTLEWVLPPVQSIGTQDI